MFEELRRCIRALFGSRELVRYDCPKPKCGADLSKLDLISGSIGRNRRGKIRGKFEIECRECGGRHTAHLSGKDAVKLFMVLQGTRRVLGQPGERALKRTIIQGRAEHGA